MNSDIRYHIASLSAVFLALGIGILIGTAFVGAPVVQRQTTLIHRLEASVGDLRRETATRDNTEKALAALVPGIISGNLMGQRVLVVQSGSYRDAADAAEETLEQAGAVVVRAALPLDAWRREMSRATSAIADSDTIADAVGNEARQIAPLLLRGDSHSSPSAFQSYRDRGLLVDGGPSETGPFRLVVLVGGASLAVATAGSADETALLTFIQQRDVPLIDAWITRGATVVAVEPLEADVSFLRVYEGSGISTIDAIDRAAGKITLPFALLGEKGNYGLRSGTDRVLPESLESLQMSLPSLIPPSSKPAAVPSAVPAAGKSGPLSPSVAASPAAR
ncbi:MAG: copper transporter [Armatimonadota bacterium]